MRVAFVTCGSVPDWEKDDRPLIAACRSRGVEAVEPRWDDPDFRWKSCAAAVVRTTWDYMPRYVEFTAWAERAGAATRLFNPPHVVRWNADKRYLRELEAAGVPLAPTEWIAPGDVPDVAALVARRGFRRAFLKPVVGASAIGTLRFDADAVGCAAAERHLATTPAPAGFLLQPYLPSVETEGETSLIYFDGAFSHAVRKVPVAGDYRVQDDYGARDFPHAPAADETDLARRALAALPFPETPLYARVDLLREDAGRPVLNELELIEPSLFFRHDPAAPARLVDALLRRLRG